jgi:hypothetical protein
MKTQIQQFGKLLIIVGVIGFAASAIVSFTCYSGLDHGTLPAVAFLIVMLGIAFAFPTLLEEGAGQLSTMRIVVFAVTLVFCTTYIKLAWSTGSFENFKIDSTWIYILGLAFGSKAFQKFGEKDDNSGNGNTPDVPPVG